MKIANSVAERNKMKALAWRLNAAGKWEGAETEAEKAAMFPVIPVPEVIKVSAWQLRKALNAAGMRAAVENAVANSGNQNLKDDWEYRIEFHSDNPDMLTVAKTLGLSDAQIIGIFKAAEAL